MKINITISLDPLVAEWVRECAEKEGISVSRFINDYLKAMQETPREKIMKALEVLQSKDLNENMIKKVIKIIKENLPKI